MMLSAQDHERVRQAVDAAEQKTSGEIVCVLARECSEYWEVPLVWGIGVALIVPAAIFLVGLRTDALGAVGLGWTAGQAASVGAAIGEALFTYAILQAVLFVVTALVVSIPPLRRALTPGALKRERVHRRAVEQFLARAYHLTEEDTGVLVFASLSERQAVVLADDGVASKVGTQEWKKVVAALTQGMKAKDPGGGFVNAIHAAAGILAEHCPSHPGKVNQLPDTVIELEF